MIHRTLAAALSVLVLSSCGDSTGSQEDGAGRMKFTYSSYVSGTFDASGTAPASGAGEFGAAMHHTSGGWLTIIAVEDNGTRYGNTVLMRTLPRVGSSTCAAGSDPSRCEFRWELLLSTPPGATVTDQANGAAVGTVEVTSLTETRARGTFSIETRASSFTPGGPSRVPMQITNGTFDVPIIPTDALNGVLYKEFLR